MGLKSLDGFMILQLEHFTILFFLPRRPLPSFATAHTLDIIKGYCESVHRNC